MQTKFRRKLLASSLIAMGSGAVMPALAQAPAGVVGLEEIVVTARRREESLQDVPISVNAVTDSKLKDMNITNFADLGSVVAGLTLDEDVIASGASLRGVKYEVLAQAPASVEFYVNDSHVTALQAIQKMFDVQQVEVLRGPQGTLRGRASPSGSIIVTTHQAELDRLGGYVDASVGERGQNYQGAFNVPIIQDVLAVRLAGFWDENDGNDVSGAFGQGRSEYEGDGFRFTVSAEPTDTLALSATYERIQPERTTFFPVESLPGAAVSIKASDLKAVQDIPEFSTQDLETTTFNVSWDFTENLALYYTGGYHSVVLEQFESEDPTNALDSSFPAGLQNSQGYLYTDADAENHEIRLQSTEPLFGKLDFAVGGLYETQKSTVINDIVGYLQDFVSPQIYQFAVGFPLPNAGTQITRSTIRNFSDTQNSDVIETSMFLNLTYHFTDATELSVGGRDISYENDDYLVLAGSGFSSVFSDNTDSDSETIYTAALSHKFNEDLLGYVNWGTSWRVGHTAIGVTASSFSDTMNRFIMLPAETSESFEVGAKSTWLDGALQVNGAVYRQEFDDMTFRPADAVFFDTRGYITGPVSSYNLQAPVPVIVNGMELEVNYQASENLTLGALLNYAKGEIDDGVVACNDYQPHDGVPDSVATAPTIGQIRDAVGNEQVATCTSDQAVNTAPDLSATLTAEYSFELAGMDAFVRGLYSHYGSSDNDPTNPIDDVDSYGILNLYTGLRSPEGSWSGMIYAKNLLDTEEVLNRDRAPETKTIVHDQLGGFIAGSTNVVSNYRQVQLTPAREFGINVRYNF